MPFTLPTLPLPTPETIAELHELSERPLSREEFERLMALPTSPEERESMDELIDWFLRRYPTPKARLDYARRMTEIWTRGLPRPQRPPR